MVTKKDLTLMTEKATEAKEKRHSGPVTDCIAEFAKPQASWRQCPTSSALPSTTGILTFSLKGHQSFHVFTSAFNVR